MRKNKNLIIGFLVIILLGLFYYFFFKIFWIAVYVSFAMIIIFGTVEGIITKRKFLDVVRDIFLILLYITFLLYIIVPNSMEGLIK